MAEFLCGWKPKQGVSEADWKAVRNFGKFLLGKGHRCPTCLHKTAKHGLGVGDCKGRDCDCPLSVAQVITLRARVKAPGWTHD